MFYLLYEVYYVCKVYYPYAVPYRTHYTSTDSTVRYGLTYTHSTVYTARAFFTLLDCRETRQS